MPVGALARTTARSPLMGVEVELEQGRHARVNPKNDVPATPAVTAVRATERLELLPVNRRAARPAVPRDDVEDDPVDEGGHRCLSPSSLRHSPRAWRRTSGRAKSLISRGRQPT